MKRVTVIGAGFGGLNAVRALRRADPAIAIDLVSPRPVFVFYPGTIWIPSEQRDPASFEVPLDDFFARNGVTWHSGTVTAIEQGGRLVRTGSAAIENDGLIIASGAAYRDDPPGREHTFLPCGGVDEMQRLRDGLESLREGTLAFAYSAHPDEPAASRSGPVLELMFGIETLLRKQGVRDRFRLRLFSSTGRPGSRMGEAAARRLARRVRRRGIEVLEHAQLESFGRGQLTASGRRYEADLTVYMPGLQGPAWFAESGLQRSPAGLLRADARCRAHGAERVYVIGDAGSFEGPDWLPKRGHVAEGQAAAAAANLLAELRGQPVKRKFSTNILYILDTRDAGILMVRTKRFALATPPLRLFHWVKRAFEWNYKKRFR